MFFLIAGNVTYFYMLHNPNNNWVSSAEVFIHKADARIKAPLYNGNERIQRKSKEYIYNNTEWLEKKVPTTHGYNNLGNPWYWSFKNSELFKNIVSITRDVRVIKKLDRIDYSSDNQFYDAYVRAVQETFPSFGVFKKDAPNFTPDKQLKVQGLSVQTTPNQTKVHFAVNNSALLSFNTPYDPSWEVYVNGKRATIIKVNAFFMGVVLHKAGEYDIQFKYRPYFTYLVFISGYLVLLVALLIGFRGMRRNKCI
ncbi:hypothetical protein HVMH_0585 [Hydrogenovibrio marinus]|nr:hypothetical protein HVMH_0585 [Hydrogenovibrio marinus]